MHTVVDTRLAICISTQYSVCLYWLYNASFLTHCGWSCNVKESLNQMSNDVVIHWWPSNATALRWLPLSRHRLLIHTQAHDWTVFIKGRGLVVRGMFSDKKKR